MVNVFKKLVNIWKKGYYYSHKKIKSKAFPTISNIEVTNACSMNCVMCPRQYMKRKVGFMDIELFEKIISQARYNSEIVLHHFGDPLLHPQIEEMIRICRKHGIRSSFSTNPSSLTDKNVKKILNFGLDHLHISLDGATKKTYEKIRRGRADYDIAISNIYKFLKEKNKRQSHKPETVIAIIRMKETKNEIEAFKKQWVNKEGIDRVDVKEFITWSDNKNSISELADEYSHKFKRKYYYPCFWPWGKFTVLWDGRVVPCCFDYDAKLVLGDLKKQTIKEIWGGRKFKKFREQNIKNNFPERHLCRNCKEKEGFPPSKIYPFNLLLKKRLNFLKYFKYN